MNWDTAIGEAALQGRVALVTGAGRGIGAAHAVALAAAGAAVMVNDSGVDPWGRHPDCDVADRVASHIRSAGGQAIADYGDIADFNSADAVVARTVADLGRIDILINNAGIIGTRADLETITQDDLERMLAVHVIGSTGTIRAAFPFMRDKGFGRIINTTSEAALSTELAAGTAYAAAKAAVWGITMAAARHAAGSGVTVNAISPGAHTRMSAGFLDAAGIPSSLDLSPSRIAPVAVALCRDDAADINGRVVHTAGGHVREYLLSRVDDSDVARTLVAAIRSQDGLGEGV